MVDFGDFGMIWLFCRKGAVAEDGIQHLRPQRRLAETRGKRPTAESGGGGSPVTEAPETQLLEVEVVETLGHLVMQNHGYVPSMNLWT